MEKSPVGKGDVRTPPPLLLLVVVLFAAAPAVALDEEEAAAVAMSGGGGARRESSSANTGRKEAPPLLPLLPLPEVGNDGCCVKSTVGPGSCLRRSAQLPLPHPGLCASCRRRTLRGA